MTIYTLLCWRILFWYYLALRDALPVFQVNSSLTIIYTYWSFKVDYSTIKNNLKPFHVGKNKTYEPSWQTVTRINVSIIPERGCSTCLYFPLTEVQHTSPGQTACLCCCRGRLQISRLFLPFCYISEIKHICIHQHLSVTRTTFLKLKSKFFFALNCFLYNWVNYLYPICKIYANILTWTVKFP